MFRAQYCTYLPHNKIYFILYYNIVNRNVIYIVYKSLSCLFILFDASWASSERNFPPTASSFRTLGVDSLRISCACIIYNFRKCLSVDTVYKFWSLKVDTLFLNIYIYSHKGTQKCKKKIYRIYLQQIKGRFCIYLQSHASL